MTAPVARASPRTAPLIASAAVRPELVDHAGQGGDARDGDRDHHGVDEDLRWAHERREVRGRGAVLRDGEDDEQLQRQLLAQESEHERDAGHRRQTEDAIVTGLSAASNDRMAPVS